MTDQDKEIERIKVPKDVLNQALKRSLIKELDELNAEMEAVDVRRAEIRKRQKDLLSTLKRK